MYMYKKLPYSTVITYNVVHVHVHVVSFHSSSIVHIVLTVIGVLVNSTQQYETVITMPHLQWN